MKKQKELSELNQKDKKALFAELANLQIRLSELRFNLAVRKQKNIREIRDARKKIARIWTILSLKAISELEENLKAKDKK